MKKIFLFLFVVAFLIVFYFDKFFNVSSNRTGFIPKKYDLGLPLEPTEQYENIECVKTKELHFSSIDICIHSGNDVVSERIKEVGIYEEPNLKLFTKYLIDNPNSMVIDIGANIGLYSLFSAKIGRDVLCVEPFIGNVRRIHKAAKMQGLDNKITLLNNAVFNQRNLIVKIESLPINQGNKHISSSNISKVDFNDSSLVESIILDDLLNYLPINSNTGYKYKKAIMKMDIEGYEAK